MLARADFHAVFAAVAIRFHQDKVIFAFLSEGFHVAYVTGTANASQFFVFAEAIASHSTVLIDAYSNQFTAFTMGYV